MPVYQVCPDTENNEYYSANDDSDDGAFLRYGLFVVVLIRGNDGASNDSGGDAGAHAATGEDGKEWVWHDDRLLLWACVEVEIGTKL